MVIIKMSGRSRYIVHIPNTESAKHNQSHPKITPTAIVTTSKQNQFKPKSAASREFDKYESYYDINNSEDYAARKQHYVTEDHIFKNRLKCQPLTNSKSKSKLQKNSKTASPIECFSSQYYPNSAQQRTPIGLIKNIVIKLEDNSPKNNVALPNDVPMDWDNYHRLAVIHKFMEDLESNYPSLCTTGTIGKSLEGRDLKVLKISNSDSSNACVWIDSGIHAREWIAPAVNTYVANHIARNFDNMPKSVRNKDWYFLPVLNPDGYEYSHTTKRMWRKNKAYVRNQLYGVDLNRNFSFAWGGLGSSDEPKHAFYRGPAPFSEPESSAIRDIFLNSGIKFKVYLTLHSFGQVIIMPFAYSSVLAQDYIRLLEGATVMSKAIFETNGNTYKVGISKDVMYQASGTSNDWSHGAVGIPYCYLIELRSKKHKFNLPKEEIAETGAEILNCVVALMEFIDNYNIPNIKSKQSEPEPKSETISPNIIESREEEERESLEIRDYKLKLSETDLTSGSDIDVDEYTEKIVTPNARLNNGTEQSDSITRCVLQMMFSIYNNNKFEGEKDKLSMQSRFSVFLKRLNKSKDKIQKTCSDCDHNMLSGDHCQKETPSSNGNNQSLPKAINIWKELNSTMDVMVEGQRINQVAAMLKERDITYSVAVSDVNALYEKELPDRRKNLSWAMNPLSSKTEMDWTSYHRLDTIYEFMDNLVKEYPYLCHVSVIGRTAEGRDIKLLKISNGKKGNEGVWIDGTIHAREWISPAVVTYIVDQLVRNFFTYPDSVTNKDWFLLPVLNPDGYEYTHTIDRMWRKNRARYGECIGVDLNRNWSHGWGEKGEEGSSDDPGNIFFRGSKPFSEAETAAVKHTILESTTTFKVFLSLHSYGEAIIFPWGCTSDPCPDYVMLLEGGTAISKAIYQTSGHTYKVGSTKDLMYYACGTSTDWSYAVANIPYSYMIELRAKEHRFLLPKEEIISTAKEVHGGIMRLLDFVDGSK